MASPGNIYTQISTATTTVIGPAATVGTARRTNLKAIFVAPASIGTIAVKSGATTLLTYPIGSVGTLMASTDGTEIPDLQITTSAADSLVVAWNNY